MAEAGAIPAATLQLIAPRAAAQYAEWKAGATAEQKAAGLAMLEKYRGGDEAFKAQRTAQMQAAWDGADADGDGKLNLAEYRVFENARRSLKEADGEWHESDHAEENYAILNSLSNGDGFTMAEMHSVFVPWMAKWEECKAADEAQ